MIPSGGGGGYSSQDQDQLVSAADGTFNGGSTVYNFGPPVKRGLSSDAVKVGVVLIGIVLLIKVVKG